MQWLCGAFDFLPYIAGELADGTLLVVQGYFKPENFPAKQSIYAGFVERNIPAIP